MSMIDRLIKLDEYLQANPESRYIIKDKQGAQKILTAEQLLEHATNGNISYLSYGSGNFIGQIAKELCKDKDGNYTAKIFEAGGY
ncbi:MAG: hypothetical protein IJW40_03165 [Clostridia bacterium]|nr:hypothetical protein [Clostridia bacterium]